VDVAEAAEALEDAQKELARLGAEEAKAEAAVHVLQGELRETQTSREVYDLQEHREVLESAVALEKDLQAALKEESKFAGEIKVWNRDIEILRTVPCGDSFPTCRFLKDAFQKKSELPQKEDDGRTAVSRVEELQKQLDKLDVPNHRAMLTTAEKLDGKIRDLRSKLQNAKLKKDNCTLKVDGQGQKCAAAEERLRRSEEQKAALEKNLWIDGEVKKLKGELRSKLGAMLDILSEEITTVTKEIGGKENLLQHLTSEVAALRELKVLCDAYEHYTEAMGKHGIAYQILVEKLPLLNDEINKILSSVADFNVFIEHDPEEQSIRLYLQYGSYRGRLLELGGGAEKMLASIALRAALLSITSLPKSNLFIIDEGFGSLDSRNLDNINRMFDYLRSVFDHVLIISHLDALKDMVDNNIEITVDEDKYSKIEVV
jgi:DNA repair exonuclease SbcCD ATPase subunit